VTWRVERAQGSAAAFHEREMVDPVERSVWVFSVSRPALVLGSTQALTVVDAPAAAAGGVEVVRRRSGGGAVRAGLLRCCGRRRTAAPHRPDDDARRRTGSARVGRPGVRVAATSHTGAMSHHGVVALVCSPASPG
jgi:hypothetical protein